MNSFSLGIYQLVVIISGFITPLIMLKYYGSEMNGLISSISQFIIYFNLVEAGLSGAAIYALYKPLANKDTKGINTIVSAAKIFYYQAGYIFITLTIGLAIAYPLLIKSEVISSSSIFFLILIIGVNGTLEFFTLAKYRVLLTADQLTYVISYASLVHIIINTVIVVILGSMSIDIVILKLVALISIFSRSIILMFYVRKKYTYINFNEKPNFDALNQRWDALYLQILGAIQVGAPIVILTIMTKDLVIVSIFTVFQMVVVGLNGLLRIFYSGLSSSFGNVIANKELSTLQKAYNEFELAYYMILSLFFVVAFIMIMPFIEIYTDGIDDANYYLPVLGFLVVLNGLFYNLKNPQGMLIMAAGMFKETRVQTTIQGLITVALGIILTYYFGIYGVVLASIIANIYRCIDLLFFASNRITFLPIIISFKRIINVLISITIIYCLSTLINIQVNSYYDWFITSFLIAIFATICIMILNYFLDKKTFIFTIKRIKGLFN